MGYLSTGVELEVSFRNHNWKLGFTLSLGFGSKKARGDRGIYIKSIESGSPIALDGRIWVGDQITAVQNGSHGSPIALDGRIWVGDQITAVQNGSHGNRMNLQNTDYETSMKILKEARQYRDLVLIVRKCEITLTNLENSPALGFTIAGGINSEFIPGDSRIYISSLIPGCRAALDGRLSAGDRLLGVRHNFLSNQIHSDDFILFDNCTHEEVVSLLKSAQKIGFVSLMVCKNENVELKPTVRFGKTYQLMYRNEN